MNNGSIKGGLSFDRTGESRSNLVWNPISHPGDRILARPLWEPLYKDSEAEIVFMRRYYRRCPGRC